MISAIIVIILGLVIWKLVPDWITQGKKSIRDAIKLICNIFGIILVLVGCYSLVRALVSYIIR